MKAVALGIADADKKNQALDDISKLKKYAQAADVTVSKQDADAFLDIAGKIGALLDDFFDCLSDVPDEI